MATNLSRIAPGTCLGPYEIVAPLGAGGMGEVYRARDTRLGRDVAIKVLPAEFEDNSDRLRRFEQEARAVAALSHPNVLAVYDVGTHEGSPYLVTELLEGETLRERLEGESVTVRKAVEVGIQIAKGLAAAHEKGIVHRDLKPSNVFLTRDDQVKLLDFGLAKLTRPEPAPGASTEASVSSTETGAVMGTAGYMSPEQVRGMPADHRTDVFSFGCVLHEMLSGARPFRGDSTGDVMAAILKEDPSPLSAGVPPALAGIVSRCLEKRPEDRFSSAHDLALALRAASGGLEARGTVRALRLPRRWLVGATVVGLLALAVGLFVWVPWRRAVPAASFDPTGVVVAVFENLTGDASLEKMGKEIAGAVADDLLKTGELKVAVNPLAAGGPGEAKRDHGGGVDGDPLLRLAEATRSALVVAGTYDLRGDQLEVQARVVDPWQGTVVYMAAPVRCPRADPVAALEPLRQHVTGAVAWRFDRKMRAFFSGFPPPRYDALIEFRLGRAAAGYFAEAADKASALAHFERASALDPEFDLARTQHSMILTYSGRLEKATKELDAIEANLGRMVPAERAMVRFHRAELEGRWLDALAALREWAALSEFPASFQLDIGLEELQVNRPAEAIRALSSLPVDWDALEYSMAHVPAQFLSIAYHMTHDYENELKVAREGQRRFPGVLPFYSAEAGALAALGRLDEIEKVIEACQAGQGGIRSGRPGLVMLTAARELRAHGYREASLRMAERAVAWFRARPAAEAAKYQEALMNALRWAERWAEAKPIAETLLAKDPDDVNLRGTIGCLAARLGDVTQARRIDGELAAITLPYMYGGQPYGRARIAAQLGEKDRAVTLLGDAFAQGKEFTWLIHVDIDLEPLWGYPPYEELMKPKG